MRRTFLVALLLSALLHLLALAAPGWQIGNLMGDDTSPIEAHLIAPEKSPAPVAKPAPRKLAAKAPARQAAIAPSPAAEETESQAPQAPEQLAAAETTPAPQAETPQPALAAAVAEAAPVTVPELAPLLPRSGRIRYSIMRGEGGFVIGQSTHEWHHDGKRYTLNATSSTTGIAAIFKPAKVTQISEGSFLKGELKPESFRFDRGDNDVVTASFDWKKQQVTLGDGQVIPIADGAEDFLSMFYQLMQAAQRGEGFVMAVATGRKVERYAFEWLGEEELKLPSGHFNAWHVLVRAASGGKDTTEVWLGKEVAGLPVKIRNTNRKAEVYDQVAEEIDYEGK